MKETIVKNHEKHFSKKPSKTFFSPATIQILGEGSHVMKGKVCMLSLSKGLYASVSSQEEHQLDVQMDFMSEQNRLTIDLTNLNQETDDPYAKRIIALVKKLQYEGYRVQQGLNISITPSKTLPENLGLHASFAMLLMHIFSEENGFKIEAMKRIRYAFSAEKNIQSEMHANIAQLLACEYGKKDHLIVVDTKIPNYECIPIKTDIYRFIHIFVNRPKFILNADITERIKGLQKATQQINEFRSIETLTDLKFNDFNRIKTNLKGKDIIKYSEHVMFEQVRIQQAADYLKQEDMIMFGDTLDQSQNSLNHLYGISNQYHNAIVETMLEKGAIGVRLSSIGYDQIIVALFEKSDMPDNFDEFKEAFYKQYKKVLDIQPIVLGDGVQIL